jgi:hypothetical protein
VPSSAGSAAPLRGKSLFRSAVLFPCHCLSVPQVMEQIKRRRSCTPLDWLLTTATYIEVRLLRERRDLVVRFLPRDTTFPDAWRCRDLDERLFRAMISSGCEVLGDTVLHAGTASSSDELPNEGNESDHEQEMNQTSGHVEDDKAKQPGYEQNHRKCGKHGLPPGKGVTPASR